MRISNRLTLTFFASALLAVVLAAYLFSRVSLTTVEAQYRTALRDTGAILLPQTRRWLTGDPTTIDSLVDEVAGGTTTRITIIDTAGTVLGDSRRSGSDLAAMENHGARAEISRALQDGLWGSDLRTSATLGTKLLYLAHPIVSDGQVIGVLRLAVPLTSFQELKSLRTRYLAAGIAAVLAASLLLAAVLSTWFLRPMQRLQSAALAIAKGDHDTPIGPLGSGEIAELGYSVERIADSLRDTIKRLEADREVQSAVFGAMREGIVALNRSGSILLANDRARKLVGESNALAGRDIFELFRQPDVTSMLTRLQGFQESGETEITLDGPPARTLRLLAIPVAESQGDLAGMLVISDLTTYVTTLRMRRDFFSNASHELRTPLTSILGYLESLEDQLPADSPLREQYLEVLLRQAERMRRIIDDLLLLAQVESDQWPVRREDYDLSAQAGQILESFKPAAEKSNQTLTLNVPSAGAVVHADREKIHVVLSNLMDNAVKYAGQDSRIELSLALADGLVEVAVADDGPGLPRTEAQRIFERFYRVDKSRSRALGGTGLGLSIVRNILAAHQVEIEVESDLGEGARFSFRLPTSAAS